MRDFIIVVALATIAFIVFWWRNRRQEIYPRTLKPVPTTVRTPRGRVTAHIQGPFEEPLTFPLPPEIACFFEAGKITVGGKARVAAYCVAKGVQWPQGYQPRDNDFLVFDQEEAERYYDSEDDYIWAPSVEAYFHAIDLVTNAVAVENGNLVISKRAWQAFSETNLIEISRPEGRELNELWYLALRAAVQAGYDIYVKQYLPRAGALRLSEEVLELLEVVPRGHYYMSIYKYKMSQIRSGHH
ncbi:MAG: hypothetical protein EBT13_10220 [Rhodobacteraceae bacterium]|nr:hypothetical protein [Paracoccaceae bacterium]